MASFLQDLWESIFTPGPTPSLLLATNVTFAALQVVLAALLVATYSVHFAALSGLCAALWWAVNWFAHELTLAQQHETAAAAALAEKKAQQQQQQQLQSEDGDDDTEVEESGLEGSTALSTTGLAAASGQDAAGEMAGSQRLTRRGGGGLSASRAEAGVSTASQGARSSASTEDEWEKVSENENEKEQ